jgi:hypothetical protein
VLPQLRVNPPNRHHPHISDDPQEVALNLNWKDDEIACSQEQQHSTELTWVSSSIGLMI